MLISSEFRSETFPAMNPYEAPPSPDVQSRADATRWAAVRWGLLHGYVFGAKWAMMLSGPLALLTSFVFVGLGAYQYSQGKDDLDIVAVIALIGFVFFPLMICIVVTLGAAAISAVAAGLWSGLSHRPASDSPLDEET
ncbi:MAG TPA: hypothetical protein VHB99_20090 [Pirellulales bacterium]|nr:hypothetical protein [Pirellulales bacterium]